MTLSHLLAPGRIGTLVLRNRIVMAAMDPDLSGEGGVAGECIRAYYEARARGGTGLIVTEAVRVLFPTGFSRPHAIALASAAQREGAAALVAAVQRHGAKLAMQLNHHGLLARRDLLAGRSLLVPDLPRAGTGDMDQLWLPAERALRDSLGRARHRRSFMS